MKRYSLFLLLVIFMVPSVVFASWWNPFSWFQKQAVQVPAVQVPIPTPILASDKKTGEEKVIQKREKKNTQPTPKQNTLVSITPTISTIPTNSGGGGAGPGVMFGPCPTTGPCTSKSSVVIDNPASTQVLPENAGCDSGTGFSSITGKPCNNTTPTVSEHNPYKKKRELTSEQIALQEFLIKEMEELKRLEELKRQQTISDIQKTKIPTPTYKELHCPQITMIKDSLGNVGRSPFQGFGIRGEFAKGTVNSITLEITATDPQGLPVYFTYSASTDWLSKSAWNVLSLESTYTFDVSNSSTGVHIVAIGIDNQDNFECIQQGQVDAIRSLEYSVY